jgi:hypothetical protein
MSVVTTGRPKQRHSLRDGVNKLLRALPGETGLVVTVAGRMTSAGLTPATRVSGPHAFAVRVRAARHAIHPRPSHSIPRSWRSRPAPRLGWNARTKAIDLGAASRRNYVNRKYLIFPKKSLRRRAGRYITSEPSPSPQLGSGCFLCQGRDRLRADGLGRQHQAFGYFP